MSKTEANDVLDPVHETPAAEPAERIPPKGGSSTAPARRGRPKKESGISAATIRQMKQLAPLWELASEIGWTAIKEIAESME